MKPKLFPKNLTARAAQLVEGNPATSRPESGTDVCTPGLEIDLRALEERFFPGLVWDYERPDAAKLIDMDDRVLGVRREECIKGGLNIFLWAILGRVYANDPEPTLFVFKATGGRTAWRRVRDLAKGRVAILFGVGFDEASEQDRVNGRAALHKVFAKSRRAKITRDGKSFVWAAMAADRLEYLDPATGVIVDPFAPGELTKGLCAPWQFDFRDCSCNYWAAGKPDMVKSTDPGIGFLNFNRNRTNFPDTPDTPDAVKRRAMMYSEEQMVAGAWRAFPTVVGDHESNVQPVAADQPKDALFSEAEAAAELTYLATVEHALIVEYLFACYSVDPSTEAGKQASDVIRLIAIDEMRHFMWVNELLQILKYAPSTGRAAVIGADPDKAAGPCGRRAIPFTDEDTGVARGKRKYLHTESQLCPLTLGTLDYFIDVEKNSRTLNGLYTHLYLSAEKNPAEFPARDRLLPILRLIIDEGEEHFQRLTLVRNLLVQQQRSSKDWLRRFAPGNTSQQGLYDEAVNYYHLLLDVVATAFALDEGGPSLLKMARDIMREMDEAILELMASGREFDWPLPAGFDPGRSLEEAMTELDKGAAKINRQQSRARSLVREALAVLRTEPALSRSEERKVCVPCLYKDVHSRPCK